MRQNVPGFRRVNHFFSTGLDIVEYIGLLVIGFATTVAIYQEVMVMVGAGRVTLADLLLMFLYLEVLAMIGVYFKTGQIPVRFPLYIAMVALARYLILDAKEISELRMVAVAGAILMLTLAVLVIRFGHVKFPYRDDEAEREDVLAKSR
ncbi:MAG: phosphate-starvation-inducible E [Betaproteobacteria bacterium]|nr:phosphate-starvation-inducible E [Betaproteobacteria bacterium]